MEEWATRCTRPEHRTFPVPQADLLASGMDPEKKAYAGDKWGGKYLRAPDIYWVILEKGKGKLVRLGDIAEVRFGIKTGANEFFYLDAERIAQWGIEEEFLRPVVKSPRECRRILIDPKDLKYKLFMCHKDKRELKGTAALEYIKWGESQGFHRRPSCAGRARWWDVGLRTTPEGIIPCSYRQTFLVYRNTGVFVDKRLYELGCREGAVVLAVLNSSLYPLFLEMRSRSYGGGGGPIDATVYEIADVHVLGPLSLDESQREALLTSLEAMSQREIGTLFEEFGTRQASSGQREVDARSVGLLTVVPDRRALDSIIFDALGLTQGERDAVYKAVIDLVEARLKKAESLQRRVGEEAEEYEA